MVVRYNKIKTLVEFLCNDQNLKVTATESLKGGLIAGGLTTLGGLLGGPMGLAVGGMVGGSLAAVLSQGKFKPAIEVIQNELSLNHQEELYCSINDVCKDFEFKDAMELVNYVRGNQTLKETIIKEIGRYLFEQFSLHLS